MARRGPPFFPGGTPLSLFPGLNPLLRPPSIFPPGFAMPPHSLALSSPGGLPLVTSPTSTSPISRSSSSLHALLVKSASPPDGPVSSINKGIDQEKVDINADNGRTSPAPKSLFTPPVKKPVVS